MLFMVLLPQAVDLIPNSNYLLSPTSLATSPVPAAKTVARAAQITGPRMLTPPRSMPLGGRSRGGAEADQQRLFKIGRFKTHGKPRRCSPRLCNYSKLTQKLTRDTGAERGGEKQRERLSRHVRFLACRLFRASKQLSA